MITAINDSGSKAVDWWFMYKLPYNVKRIGNSGEKTSGFEYLYYDCGGLPLPGISSFRQTRKIMDRPFSASP